jgi:hypothetical protein
VLVTPNLTTEDEAEYLAATLDTEGGLYEPHRPLLCKALTHFAR